MAKIPAFDCAQCGRRIGVTGAHFILKKSPGEDLWLDLGKQSRVFCINHHEQHRVTDNIAHGFCTRTATARLLGVLT